MKRKLMAYILTTIIFILIVITVLFTSIFNHQYEENVKKNLRNNNNLLVSLLQNKSMNYEALFNHENFKNLPIRVTLINDKGKVLFDSEADEEVMDNHNARVEIIQARKSGEGFSIRFSNSVQRRMMYYATEYNGYIIRSSLPIASIKIFSDQYIKYYFFVIILIILLSIWSSNKLSYIIVKPIRDLDFITSRIAKGELHRRVNVVSDDEIGKLGKNFNHMTDRLEATLNDVIDKQNRLEAILRSMNSGVIAVDRNNKVIMINPYAKKMFGIRKNIIGRNLLDNIRDFELEKALKSNDEEYREIKILWPEERMLRIKTTDIINRSEHIGTVAVVQDITDIKKLENIRSQFVANVSHELKTPLTSIKGFAETLKEVDDQEIRDKFLDIINDEAERLTRLINDILILSHIEQQREVKDENVEVNKIVSNVCDLIRNTSDKKNISLSVEGSKVENLMGDSDKLKQMLINLIDNAVKYSEPGDSVIVGTKEEDGDCIIWVKDTGTGIPEEHIPRLFERFYRVDKARSRAKGGTGLGLAIVKHIVILFGGTIEVDSELGVGTKFTIRIPYDNEKSI